MENLYKRDVSFYSKSDLTDLSLAEVLQLVRDGEAAIVDLDTEFLDNPHETESEWKLGIVEEVLDLGETQGIVLEDDGHELGDFPAPEGFVGDGYHLVDLDEESWSDDE